MVIKNAFIDNPDHLKLRYQLSSINNLTLLDHCKTAIWFGNVRSISVSNPIWTGPFANPKRLGAKFSLPLPPNLAISNQMMMKLGKSILWIEIFRNSHKF